MKENANRMPGKKRCILLIIAFSVVSTAVFAGGGQQVSSASGIGFNAEGLPVVSKPYTMTAAVQRRNLHGHYADMEIFQDMEKKTGIHIEWIEIPDQVLREQINLMLSSNDLPDIFMNGIRDEDVLRYGQLGTFVRQNELIEQYAPRIKNLFTQRPDIKKYVTTPEGGIYILPRLQELAYRINPENMFINKVWLDKLGLAVPTTYQELYTVLKAFKERDPNGNGKQDEIPMSWPSNYTFQVLFAGFGANLGTFADSTMVTVKNGKVSFVPDTPEYREALTYFNRLYAEGLIDPEVFTQTIAQYTAKGMGQENVYGVFIDWFDELSVGEERARREFVMLPPLKNGPSGKQVWPLNPIGALDRQNFAITEKMKNPEVAIRWADFCYDLDNSYALCLGSWNIVLRRQGDKVIVNPAPEGMTDDEFRYKHSPAHTTPFAIPEVDYNKIASPPAVMRKLERLETYRKFFCPVDEIYPKVYFLPEEENELAIIRNDIRTHVNRFRASFVSGAEPLTTGWNAYVQEFNKMGLPKYLELYQKALDRYNAN